MWSLALVSSEKFGELVVVLLLFKDKNKRKFWWRDNKLSIFLGNLLLSMYCMQCVCHDDLEG